jgi:hypothetical protein
MSSDATLGFGSQIYQGLSADSIANKIAQSIDLKSPESEIPKVKITNNDSPANSHEYIPGLTEPGETEFEWVYTKTQQASLFALHDARTHCHFKEVFPDGSGWKFEGWISKVPVTTKTEDEAIHGTVTIILTSRALFMAAVS